MMTPFSDGAGQAACEPACAALAEPRRLRLERAAVSGGVLAFESPDGLRASLRQGCFALEIPPDLDLDPGITLSREFYRAPEDGDPGTRAYRGFRARSDVYFDREHFQTEHVLIDGPGRQRLFPPALVAMCDEMNELALLVLRCVLEELGVARALWSRVTGGAIDNMGTHWFASSHYRPERELPGCAPHKDTGFATILYFEQEGLEASVGGGWASIDPVPGCFLVNFGGALEILTRNTHFPVQAILHRVRQTTRPAGGEDRFSFAAFANPPAIGVLYECDKDGVARPYQRVEEFLSEFNKVTWHDRHDDFGIR
jgi:hypothetical protein